VQSFQQSKEDVDYFGTTLYNPDKTLLMNPNEQAKDLIFKEICLNRNTSFINHWIRMERMERGLEEIGKAMKQDHDALVEIGRKQTTLNQTIDKEIRRYKLINMIDKAEKELEVLQC